MKLFTDQLGRRVEIAVPPKRIISLVPSQTELLFDLELDEEVVGITKFCIHPEEKFRTKPKIGGTKKVDLRKIKSLQPDLIIGNKEENEEQQIKELMNEFPVWMSNIKTLQDSYAMIHTVGEIVDKKEKADGIIAKIKFSLRKFQFDQRSSPDSLDRKSVYLIWRNPYLTIGSDTFIHHMMEIAGFENIFSDRERYPEITVEEIKKHSPDYLLLASEPYPFKEKHREELQHELPSTKFFLVDGEMFSWYGSRLLKSASYFEKLQKEITSK